MFPEQFNILSVFTLLAGLAFFLFGMNVMSGGLEKMSGGKLESGLKKLTSNNAMGLALGAGITIAIQSSSAMTVMLVGFVNSGIMQLSQTISVMMGSNVGTTLTAWITALNGLKGSSNVFLSALKPESFSPIFALIGIMLFMLGKNDKRKQLGSIYIGFAILMYGMIFMSESMSPLRDMPEFENILRMLRPDKKYTALEAKVLDTALILHMEHGGGNNSSFTTHVVTSAGSDTYSVTAAALSSLKGPKHGGANFKVVEMIEDLKKNVSDTKDTAAVRNYLEKLVDKQAFDKKGLIYGMGHAIYSVSDPRAQVFKSFVKDLAVEKGREDDYELYSLIEQLGKEVIAEKRKIYKGVSVNVDFYSGFVYSMLGIPHELFTPIFAIARVVGWSAHRIEELINTDKIIRPAYTSVSTPQEYVPLEER